MPLPEPVPFVDCKVDKSHTPRINNLEELNNLIKHVIDRLASAKMYTGVGLVQSELFKICPDALRFIQVHRLHPNAIPAIRDHHKLILHANALLWGYAVSTPILTLEDMNKLLKLEFRDLARTLGPVFNLPAALELCGVSIVHQPVMDAFMTEDETSVFRPSRHVIFDELNACICKNRHEAPSTGPHSLARWWEAVFTRHLLLYFGDPCLTSDPGIFDPNNFNFSFLGPYGIRIKAFSKLLESIMKAMSPNALSTAFRNAESMIERSVNSIFLTFSDNVTSDRALAKLRTQKPKTALRNLACNCRSLHSNLLTWAEKNNLHWRIHYLDTLLTFADYLDGVARKGPLKSILHLVLTYSNSEAFCPDLIPSKLHEGIIDLVPPDPPIIDLVAEDELVDQGGRDQEGPEVLDDIVNCFNEFIENFSRSTSEETLTVQIPWRCLADFEKQLQIPSGNTLLTLLADASTEELKSPKPKCLCIDGPTRGVTSREQQSKEESSSSEVKEFLNVPRLRHFLRHLTYLKERSAETLMKVVVQNLDIPYSSSVVQAVQCILTDAYVSTARSYFFIHPQEYSFLRLEKTDNLMTPTLFTHRSAVLRLIAMCPVLEDPEKWCLWCHPPFSLASHWGPFDEFLAEVASDTNLCEKFNCAVVKLANSGYIRLSTNGTPSDLDTILSECLSAVDICPGSAAVRKLCDLLIGATLLVNRFIPLADCVNILSGKLQSFPFQVAWIRLVRFIILKGPLQFLGVLFSKVLHPAFKKMSFSLEKGEGLETLLDFTTEAQEWNQIVTAIGVIGSQLGWSKWIEIFRTNRLSSSECPDSASTYSSTDLVTSDFLMCSQKTTLAGISESPPRDISRDEISSKEKPISDEELTDRRKFIETLRKKEFGIGVDLSVEAAELLRRLEGRLCRSLDHLSRELYGQPSHFVLELIQNADDNIYAPDDMPCIKFVLSPNTLTVCNNEAVGFSTTDISALCNIGVSTKIGHRDDKTGRKGIGFKSVFAISDAPEVHSNGFHVRFRRDRSSDGSPTSILAPEWVVAPCCEFEREWRTVFRFPLCPSTCGSSASAESILEFARHLLTHHIILFLRRINRILFQTTLHLPIRFELQLERESRLLFASGDANSSVLKLLTVMEARDDSRLSKKWLLFQQRISVDAEKLHRLVETSSKSSVIPRQTSIAIALPLLSEDPLPTFPIYAFLPVRRAGFHFLLNADFDLTSSREDIDESSVWNHFLVNRLASVFEGFIDSVIKMSNFDGIPLSQYEILGLILECLPVNNRGSASATGIFACLEEQIRERLSKRSWLPVLNGIKFSFPSKVLLTSQNSLQTNDCFLSEQFLVHLLTERLGMYELDPAFLLPSRTTREGDERQIDWDVSLARRMENLFFLGAQHFSADSLIEMASTLSAEELSRPGFLYALLANIDSSMRFSSASHRERRPTSLANRLAWQRRCLCRLRGLRLFPLLDGRLVSLEEIDAAMANGSDMLVHRNGLMIPPKPPDSEKNQSKSVYDDYLGLLSRLGPLLSPSAIYPSDNSVFALPGLLTKSDDGLGLGVANSPVDVINHWIVPHQTEFNFKDTHNSDWFVAAAQLIVYAGQLDEMLISHLPIVCKAAKSVKLFNPLTDVAFLPPLCLKNLPDTGEFELMSMCLGAIGRTEVEETKKDSVMLVTPSYFTSCGSSLGLNGIEANTKWQRLFSLAGISSIQSLHPQRYRLSDAPAHIACLPKDHDLRVCSALTSLEGCNNVVIEDWICPGLEKFVLPWIEEAIGRLGFAQSVRTVCEKLASLLNRNWSRSFESYTLAVACVAEEGGGRVPLGASSWLRALRTRRWLVLTFDVSTTFGCCGDRSKVVAATVNRVDATMATDFVASPPVYVPSALRGEDNLAIPLPLFAPLCPIWQPSRAPEVPLASGLIASLGLKSKLDESSFRHLMDHLAKDPNNPPRTLTIKTIVQVYRLALKVFPDADDVLYRLFSSTLLVPCPAAHAIRQNRRKPIIDVDLDRQEEEEEVMDCPVCLSQTAGKGSKRPFLRTSSYHLVPAHRTCWTEAQLPPAVDDDVSLEGGNVEIDEEEEDECVDVPVPPMKSLPACPPYRCHFDRRAPLRDVYGSEWEKFFCEILKVPRTSSLNEVLSLRPSPPSATSPPSASRSQWRAAQEAFGRRLAAWYSLINCSFFSHSAPPDEGDELANTLRDFPLLYDMTGSWRLPRQITKSLNNESLFAWSAADLASMLPPECLLGHSLDILGSDVPLPIFEKRFTGKSNSLSLLLNVLRLPILEDSVEESVGFFDRQNTQSDKALVTEDFAVPSPSLGRMLAEFRLLTLAWLSSRNARSRALHSAASAPFNTAHSDSSCILEGFLLPNLAVRLTLMQTTGRLSSPSKEWTFPGAVCRFFEGKFYLDKHFEADFGTDHDDVAFLCGPRGSIQDKMLVELTRAVFPRIHGAQISLLHFARGFLSLRSSLMLSSMRREEVWSQLRAYLLSHGIPVGSPFLHSLLRRFAPGGLPPVPPVPPAPPISAAACVSAPPPSAAIVPQTYSAPPPQNRRGPPAATQFQTPLFAALALEKPDIPDVPQVSASTMRASFIANSVFPLPLPSCKLTVGRLGEQSVYEDYLKRLGGLEFDFPSGHPLLGSGRIVEVNWVNGDGESRLPYDLTVFLEVSGNMSVIRTELNLEVRNNVIRQSAASPTHLLVGPIYVEVKSTSVLTEVGEGAVKRPELFEISLAEAAFARVSGWRYHLVRVRWSRRASDNNRCLEAPQITHIPNLARSLTEDPSHHQLFIGLN